MGRSDGVIEKPQKQTDKRGVKSTTRKEDFPLTSVADDAIQIYYLCHIYIFILHYAITSTRFDNTENTHNHTDMFVTNSTGTNS